jgi:hypothetical protein
VRKRLVEGGHHFNPILASGGPGGTHHQEGEGHHADGQTPAHHADGQKPAHHAEGEKPAHHAEGQAPAHHAEGEKPAQPAQPGDVAKAAPGAPGHAEAPGHAASPGATTTPGAPGHAAGAPGHTEAPGHAADEGHAKDGHHHDADGAGIGYDPGFVIVSRGSKKTFVDASRNIAKLAAAPQAAPLTEEWTKVAAAWAAIKKDAE